MLALNLPSLALGFVALAFSSLLVSAAPSEPHPLTTLLQSRSLSVSSFLTLGSVDIPKECETSCSSLAGPVNKCLKNDLNGCLKVCEQDLLNQAVGCDNCLLVYSPKLRANPSQAYQQEVTDQRHLLAACASRGIHSRPDTTLIKYDDLLAAINGSKPLVLPTATPTSGASSRVGLGASSVAVVLGAVALALL